MGSPLGVTFANFYMCNLENTVFANNPALKPRVYCRFVDDCFLIINSELDLLPLINAFKNNSVLNFTYELGDRKLNFLDVSLEHKNGTLNTSVYKKPTDPGIYLSNQSECPQRYKEGMI